MYIKSEYIPAINDALDFIENNTDGASTEHQEIEVKRILKEIRDRMEKARYKQYLKYYIRKAKEKPGQ